MPSAENNYQDNAPLTSKLQMRTWFPFRSYPTINPETSGSMIQCSNPTRLPTTERRSALKWIVIMVSSVMLVQKMWKSSIRPTLHVDSPSLSIFKVSLTRLLAPSQAITCWEQSSYVFFAPRSSIRVVTRPSCCYICQTCPKSNQIQRTCSQLMKEWFFRISTNSSWASRFATNCSNVGCGML